MGLAAFNRWRRDQGVEGAGAEHQGTVTDGEQMEAPEPEEVTDAPSESVEGEPTVTMDDGAELTQNDGDDRDALAAEYEARFGKKPGNMKTATIKEKLAEADEE